MMYGCSSCTQPKIPWCHIQFSCQLSICQSHPPKYGCCAKLFSFFSNSKPFTPAAAGEAGEAEAPFGVGVVTEGLLALGLLTNSTVTGPSLQRFTFRDGAWWLHLRYVHLDGVMYVNTRISKFIQHTHRYSSLPDVCVDTFLKWCSQIDIPMRNIAVSIRWCTLMLVGLVHMHWYGERHKFRYRCNVDIGKDVDIDVDSRHR